MLNALRYKYQGAPTQFLETIIKDQGVARIDLTKFCELYSSQTRYPADRLGKLAYKLMDVKMQLYYITEADCYGIVSGATRASATANPHLKLLKLSSAQNVIVKSRILWERVMNFVYYLVTGNDLELGKSKKTKFFKFIATTDWSFLGHYRSFVDGSTINCAPQRCIRHRCSGVFFWGPTRFPLST